MDSKLTFSEKLGKAIDDVKLTRRIGFFVVLWLTVNASLWSLDFPAKSANLGYTASDVAIVIGAVMGPITMLLGFVINFYYSKGTKP